MTSALRHPAAGLLALVLLAGAARLHGLGAGLPTSLEPDAKLEMQVEYLRDAPQDEFLLKEASWYPSLIGRIASLLPRAQRAPAGAPLQAHLDAAARPHWQVRLVVALLSLGAIPLTYALARRFLDAAAALLAAAAVATSLLFLNFSQQSRPHAVAVATFALTLWSALRYRERGGWRRAVGVGLSQALAFGTLQSAVALLPALGVAWGRRALAQRRAPWLDAALALAISAAGAALFYGAGRLSGVRDAELVGGSVLQLSGHLIYLSQFRGRGLPVMARALWSYDPWLATALLAAPIALLAARRRAPPSTRSRSDPSSLSSELEPRGRAREAAWILGAFALPYALALALYENSAERFLLPLLPCIAIVAAAGVSALGRLARPHLALGVASASLLVPAWANVRLGNARAAPNTAALAARWLLANHPAPRSPVMVFKGLDLPLVRPRDELVPLGRNGPQTVYHLPWIRYQREALPADLPGAPYPLRWMSMVGPGFFQASVQEMDEFVRTHAGEIAVIEVYRDNRVQPNLTQLRESVRRSGTLLARFSPDTRGDFGDVPFGFQDETSVPPAPFFRRTLQAACTGPVVEIYALRAQPSGAASDPDEGSR